jgi:hypothetical protein
MTKHTSESIYFWAKKLDFDYPLAVKIAKEYLQNQLLEIEQQKIDLQNDKFLNCNHEGLDRLFLEHYYWGWGEPILNYCRKECKNTLDQKENGLKLQLKALSKIQYNTTPKLQEKIDTDFLKNKVSIETVADFLGLKKQNGMYFSAFKTENTPSMKLYPDTNSFCCYATGNKGDTITLVQHCMNTDFITATKFLQSNF